MSRVLLFDGAGLTGREVATALTRAGHRVEVMSSDPLALTRCTRTVARVHPAPHYSSDPFAWLDVVCALLAEGGFDALIPTQEQVAVLAARPDRILDLGVGLAVPSFAALCRVQDKASAVATLSELGLPQPAFMTVRSPQELCDTDILPGFVKTAVGTASSGVTHVKNGDDLLRVAKHLESEKLFDPLGVVIQAQAQGPVVMIQAVYARGDLIASHAAVRSREGRSGGSSSKESIDLPSVRDDLAALGGSLRWHGALSLDAVLTDSGPMYIDVNPRIIEPVNGLYAGVDLSSALLSTSLDLSTRSLPDSGRGGVRTHTLLQALAGAASNGRRSILAELAAAIARRGPYRNSREELTPVRADPITLAPVVVAALALLASPSIVGRFESSTVGSYSLTPEAWERIKEHVARGQ